MGFFILPFKEVEICDIIRGYKGHDRHFADCWKNKQDKDMRNIPSTFVQYVANFYAFPTAEELMGKTEANSKGSHVVLLGEKGTMLEEPPWKRKP